MSKQAADFVAAVSKDPAKIEQFYDDPDAAMAGYDLSEKDKAVLRTGDRAQIDAYLGAGGFASSLLVREG